MFTSEIIYLCNLRTEAKHIQSGNTMITDAPVDNMGKGEFFSPTDTVATALATCMLTTMGIVGQAKGIELGSCYARVTKHMASSPRRIAAIDVELHLSGSIPYTENEKMLLESTARGCPVAVSLHPDIKQNLQISYDA